MEFLSIVIVASIFIILAGIAGLARKPSAYEHRKVTIRAGISEDGTRAIARATGTSADEAMHSLCCKLESQAKGAVKSETIKKYVDAMESAINQMRNDFPKYPLDKYMETLEELRKHYDSVYNIEQKKKKEKEDEWRKSHRSNVSLSQIERERRLVTAKLRYEIIQRDGGRCCICGRSPAEDGVKLHVDHIIPVSKGGKTEASNLQTLCESCNLGKGNRIAPQNNKTLSDSHHEFTNPVRVESEKSTEKSTKTNYTISEAISLMAKSGIDVIDKTNAGGYLWVASTEKSDLILPSITIDGSIPRKTERARAFDNKPGWFIKPSKR